MARASLSFKVELDGRYNNISTVEMINRYVKPSIEKYGITGEEIAAMLTERELTVKVRGEIAEDNALRLCEDLTQLAK